MTRWMQVAQKSEIEHGESKVVKLGDERVGGIQRRWRILRHQ